MKQGLITFSVFSLLILLAGSAYYFQGNHNHIGSRSYYLEKDIRTLLYLETHEPIDYRRALEDYRALLTKINFDDPKEHHINRYFRAIERTKFKSKALDYFDLYGRTSEIENLEKAWSLLTSTEYRESEEYYFTSFYWRDERITQSWIDEKLRRSPTSQGRERREAAPSNFTP